MGVAGHDADGVKSDPVIHDEKRHVGSGRRLSAIALSGSAFCYGCGAQTVEPPHAVTAASAEPPHTALAAAVPFPSVPAALGPAPSPVGGKPAVGAAAADAGAASASESSAPATRAADVPSACPENMALVDGEYCTSVEQSCEKSWYAEQNQKLICERFAAPSRCSGERLHKRYCIDRYEWPNRAGERPEVMNNFYQAMVKCAAVGKRMCTESEWTLACEGPRHLPYPYGYERDSSKCNGDRAWDDPDMPAVARRDPSELARLWQGKRSGSQPECVSAYGVHDLPGNADEVVASENFGSTWRGKYESVTTGGPWYKGVRNQCRPKIYTHDEGFYHYYLGFRCCAEADGASTDPRTPKQLRSNTAFARVERLARFSLDEMKEKLRLAAEGRCTCTERDVLCKTMCGTLLGPNATDAP
jgi:formylglycine-generating enzyme